MIKLIGLLLLRGASKALAEGLFIALCIILNGAGVWLCSYVLNSIFQLKQLTFMESCLIGCVLSFTGVFFKK